MSLEVLERISGIRNGWLETSTAEKADPEENSKMQTARLADDLTENAVELGKYSWTEYISATNKS
jgi:hypothetical protein